MSRQTALLIHPTIEECVKAALALGMPEIEGRKFFYHYQSQGWKVGKLPMKSFDGAMGGWHCRYVERTGGTIVNGHVEQGVAGEKPLSGAVMMVKQKELERILEKIKTILRSYDSHADRLRPDDREEMKKLRLRRDTLKKDLGIEY